MEYIDLNPEEPIVVKSTNFTKMTEPIYENVEVVEKDPKEFKKKVITPIEAPQIEYRPKEDLPDEEREARDSCGIEKYYPDTSKEDYFKRENLFAELVNEYQRSMARFNLGIGEEYSLAWGNITGTLSNQTDIHDFILDFISRNLTTFYQDINALLVEFTREVNFRLLQNDESSFLRSVRLSKDHMFNGDAPQAVALTWEFLPTAVIQEIRINDILYEGNNNTYVLPQLLSEDTIIQFSYKSNDKWYNRFLIFYKLDAYYYGFSGDRASMAKTKESSIIVDSGKQNFVYLYLPKDNARISVDNIYGGFRQLSSTIINGVRYYLYQTVNAGLGKIYISYDK